MHAQRVTSHAERHLADLRAEVEESERRYGGSGEAEVIIGKQLSAVLTEWREAWELKYDFREQSDGRVMGPIDWLKEMTGVHARRCSGLLHGEYKYVNLSQADLFLTVIDKVNLLTDGTLRIIPNPAWSPERWMAYMEERGCL